MSDHDKQPGAPAGEPTEQDLRRQLAADLSRAGVRVVEAELYQLPEINFSKFEPYAQDIERYCYHIYRYLMMGKVFDGFTAHQDRRDFRQDLEGKYFDHLPKGWDVYKKNCFSGNCLTGLDASLELFEEKLNYLELTSLATELKKLQQFIDLVAAQSLLKSRERLVDKLKEQLKFFLDRLALDSNS